MIRRLHFLGLSLCAVLLAAPFALGQQDQQPQQPEQPTQTQSSQQSSGPIPAYRSPLASVANGAEDDETQQLAPDTRSLSGAQYLSLGIPMERSYWQPIFNVSTTADSNGLETANSAGWGTWVSLSGGIDVHHTSENNDLTLSYTSGGMISNVPGTGSGVVQGLNIADRITFRRSSLSFLDNLNYLPESAFGYGGIGGSLLSGGTTGVVSGFTPGQSLLVGQGQNLGNAFVAELDEAITPRASLTFVGGYSLQHFFNGGFLNYNDYNFRGGYNYQTSPKNTIAFLYTFTGIRYNNFNQSMDSHTVQASYARRVTGRLTFQLSAGPQIAISTIPITGPVGSTGSVGGGSAGSVTQLFWALTSALQWQAERNAVSLTYNHGVAAGSGVLAGSLSDVITGSVTRKVSRAFSDGINAGFSRNEGVAITGKTPTTQTYGYWFGGVNLSHPMGERSALNFSYQLQYQSANSQFCIGPSCGTSIIRHMFTVGLGWRGRPLLF